MSHTTAKGPDPPWVGRGAQRPFFSLPVCTRAALTTNLHLRKKNNHLFEHPVHSVQIITIPNTKGAGPSLSQHCHATLPQVIYGCISGPLCGPYVDSAEWAWSSLFKLSISAGRSHEVSVKPGWALCFCTRVTAFGVKGRTVLVKLENCKPWFSKAFFNLQNKIF